jgi:hypothetical protein
MKFKDTKKGLDIRWTSDRRFKSWDTYGVILKKGRDYIEVMTYDDFKVTKLSKGGEAIGSEIHAVDSKEVTNYLEDRVANLEKRKITITTQYNREIREVDELIERLRSL